MQGNCLLVFFWLFLLGTGQISHFPVERIIPVAVSSQACSETEVPWSQAGQTWAGAVVHIASNSQIRREAFVC